MLTALTHVLLVITGALIYHCGRSGSFPISFEGVRKAFGWGVAEPKHEETTRPPPRGM